MTNKELISLLLTLEENKEVKIQQDIISKNDNGLQIDKMQSDIEIIYNYNDVICIKTKQNLRID